MRLVRAEFENFRLLRELSLDFAANDRNNLVVIRAENETGKTTIMNGLQWALYGDDALPDRGQDYRLHPIDWDSASRSRVPISVSVEFETTSVRRTRDGVVGIDRRYRIVRSAVETIDGTNWTRGPSTAKLFQITDDGDEPLNPPEARIREELPPELREVFFTDGDRALSFIEATVSLRTKRDRVQKAIRSLLGLGVLEDVLKHVKKSASEVNKAARNVASDQKLSEATSRLEEIENEIGELDEKREDAERQFQVFDERLSDIQRQIDVALVRGNRSKLKLDIERTDRNIKELDAQRSALATKHSELFRTLSLSRDLLGPVLEDALTKLNELRTQGKIPNTTIPVLEERLTGTTCICGESLDPEDSLGEQRRQAIKQLIDDSRKADDLQSMISELYFGSRSLDSEQIDSEERWRAQYERVFQQRDRLTVLRREQGKAKKALEARLEAIPDTNVQGLQATKKKFAEQRDRLNADRARYETQLEGLRQEREGVVWTRNNLLREQEKGTRILAELEVVQDVERIFVRSYDRITNEELSGVSTLMNDLFLEMIGADPQQGAIIQKTVISRDFDILVYGPDGRTLNPDLDLNGASRRALTLAFILSLAKVSEIEAPNVIDTPLGMMGGFVRRSVLRTAIQESSQLVLFLTRAEILQCEDILDEEAGRVITLTNPAHYPRMLVNDPNVTERMILKCDCDHRTDCTICARRMDVESEVEVGL